MSPCGASPSGPGCSGDEDGGASSPLVLIHVSVLELEPFVSASPPGAEFSGPSQQQPKEALEADLVLALNLGPG